VPLASLFATQILLTHAKLFPCSYTLTLKISNRRDYADKGYLWFGRADFTQIEFSLIYVRDKVL
jgi:hypothetical protein